MEKGFIKIHRSLFDNKIWQAARAFSECEAWIDLIQSARFEASPTTSRIGCYEVTWGRGQYPASNRFLAKKWGRSEQWVRTFLGRLKREGMITTGNDQGITVITLTNYSKYNDIPSDNTPINSPNNAPIDLNDSELQRLVTHLLTQVVTHLCEKGAKKGEKGANLQHTSNPNKKKDKDNIIGDSRESLVCGTSQSHDEKVDFHALVDFFNSETNGAFGMVREPISERRRGMINARIREHGREAFVEMIRTAAKSPFLRGQNRNGWRATFDWLIKPTNFEKVISGNYDRKEIDRDSGSASIPDGSEELMRNIAEGIARGNLARERRE